MAIPTQTERTFETRPADANYEGSEFYYRHLEDPTRRAVLRAVAREDVDVENDSSLMPVLALHHDPRRNDWSPGAQTQAVRQHANGWGIAETFRRLRSAERDLARRFDLAVLDHEKTAEGMLERWLRSCLGWSEVTVSAYHDNVPTEEIVIVRGYIPSWLTEMGLPADHKRTPGEGRELTAWMRGEIWEATTQHKVHWEAQSDHGQTRSWTEWVDDEDTVRLTVFGSAFHLTSSDRLGERFDPDDLV